MLVMPSAAPTDHKAIVLGRGVRVWNGFEAIENAYYIEAVSSPKGVTHISFTRKN
jgi:hypothetical protein